MTAENQEIYNTRVVDTSQGIGVELDEGCPDEFAEVIARTFRTGKPQQGTFEDSGAFRVTDHFLTLEEQIIKMEKEIEDERRNYSPSKLKNFIAHTIEFLNKSGRTKEYSRLVANAVEKRRKEIISTYEKFLDKDSIGLDIGAGNGNFSALSTKNKLFALDISTKKHPNWNVKFIQGNAESLPVASKSLDFVTMLYSLHHFDNFHQVFSEAKRVLKPNGILVVLEEHARYPGHEAIMKINDSVANRVIFPRAPVDYSEQGHYFTKHQLKELFNDYGFKILAQKQFPANRPIDVLYKSLKNLYIVQKDIIE